MPGKTPSQSVVTYVLAERSKIQRYAPAGYNVDSLLGAFNLAVQQNPQLALCTGHSIANALKAVASLGIELGVGPMAHAYLIPFKNSQKQTYEAQLQVGVHGLIYLAYKTGLVESVSAHVVYEGDSLKVTFGTEENITHEPSLSADRGDEKIVAAYCVIRMKEGGFIHEIMSRAEIDRIRAVSKQPNSPLWTQFYSQAALKTVVKRALRRLPLALAKDALARAIEVEEAPELVVEVEPEQEQKTAQEEAQPQQVEPSEHVEKVEKEEKPNLFK
jgi:recombination protein RecT